MLVWTPEEVEAFREHHTIETKAKLAIELLITGIRRSDIVRAGRQHR